MAQRQQQTARTTAKKNLRIPLVGNAQQRDTSSDKDQRYVNYVFETTKNSVTDTKKLFVVKRPGTTEYLYPSGAAGEGRGLWYFNGNVWSIVGSSLYMGTTHKRTLTTETGECGAVEFVNTDDFSNLGLFIADGVDAWIVNSSNTVTQVNTKYTQWTSNTIIEEGDRRVPTTLGALWYVCITAGRTASSQPSWPTIIGNTVTDGTVVWRCEGTYEGPNKWSNSSHVVGDLVIPTSENNYWYECITAGTGDITEPTWPIILGESVTEAAGGTVWECKGEYGGFPSPHVPTPMFMDGYIFLPKSGSIDIYGTNVSAPTSWSPLNFVGAESYPDPILGLARQNNFIVAFGDKSIEFMYNAAKANSLTDYDSPLDRHESLVLQVGILNRNALIASERTLVFIGISDLAGKSIWRMDGNNAKEISTEYIEKFLDLENNTTDISGWGVRIFGHILFVINLPTADKTFVYDIEENIWTEWSYNGGALPFNNFCDANGIALLQHKNNGKIYKLDPNVYQDFGTNIQCLITLAKQDFDTDNYKFFHQITLIGDTPQHADVLRWSDDDYTTWTTDKTLAITNRPYFMRSGKARRRAWEFEYTQNSPRRLEAIEVNYTVGDH